MSPETLKRKTSPSPLPLARDVGAPVRPLSPLRRAAVPLGVAGLLSAAAAAAIVHAADPPCPVPGAAPEGPYTRFSSGLSNIVHKFLDPKPEHVAGEMMPVSPPIVPAPVAPASINPPTQDPEAAPTTTPAQITTPDPTTTPAATTTAPTTKKPPKHIEPTPVHPKLAGKPMPPHLDSI